MQLEAISSCPIACYPGEDTNTCPTTMSFQLVVESNKVSPQPPLLQTKQPQLFPEPLALHVFWFRLQPATKAPRSHPSPRRGAEENGKKQAETGGSG